MLGWTQSALAEKAHVSRATIDTLENSRLGELGYSRDHQYSRGSGT